MLWKHNLYQPFILIKEHRLSSTWGITRNAFSSKCLFLPFLLLLVFVFFPDWTNSKDWAISFLNTWPVKYWSIKFMLSAETSLILWDSVSLPLMHSWNYIASCISELEDQMTILFSWWIDVLCMLWTGELNGAPFPSHP